jgi:hypothetical protein
MDFLDDDSGSGTQHECVARDPHKQQMLSFKQFWEGCGNEELHQNVVEVLDFMKAQQLNLPVFLWAISWGVSELIADDKARYARTALMMSTLLPQILRNWHKPPHAHSLGIRTEAARVTMDAWALDAV